jgi:ribosomal-protein-alanine N-acetyltransferase
VPGKAVAFGRLPWSRIRMRLVLETSLVRDWTIDDLPALVRHANNARIAADLRDRFPHPYSEAVGRGWLEYLATVQPSTVWAIAVNDEAVGSIGLQLQEDVERVSAELGYWLGEAFWGRGITTDAVRAVTAQAFDRFSLTRVYALPFAENAGSIRVLEKAGFALEGRLRRSAIKEGVIRDQLLFAAYR